MARPYAKRSPHWLNIDQAATVLGCSQSQVRKLVAKRKVRFYQPAKGSMILFRQEWLTEYVDAHTSEPTGIQPTVKARKPNRAKPTLPPGPPFVDPALYKIGKRI